MPPTSRLTSINTRWVLRVVLVAILPQIVVPPSRLMKRSDAGHDNPKPGVSGEQSEHDGCCGAGSWLGCSGLGVNFGQTEGERGAADESRGDAATMRAETFAQLLTSCSMCSQFFSIKCLRNLENKTQ